MILKILGALVALGLGIWLGLPGRYSQDLHEIEEIMDQGGGRRRRAKVYFTPLAWLQRKVAWSGKRKSRQGRFRLKLPDDRD